MGGTAGVHAPILQHLLESMLEGELSSHLEQSNDAGESNRKNDRTKTVRSRQSDHLEVESSRDRQCTFEPKILPKRQLITRKAVSNDIYQKMEQIMDDYFAEKSLDKGILLFFICLKCLTCHLVTSYVLLPVKMPSSISTTN
jgi:hypothetical protein